MISYYDLLTLIKTTNHIPKEVKLFFYGKYELYFYSKEDNCYLLKDNKKVSINFQYYLNECITDIQAFDKIIKIIEN